MVQVLFETTGCRLNQIESESAARFFLDKGFKVSLVPLTAKNVQDTEVKIAVINTCAVTQKAEQKDRRIIRLVLEKAPCATVIVTGCYAQLSYNDIKAMDLRIAVLKGQQKSRLKKRRTGMELFLNIVSAALIAIFIQNSILERALGVNVLL
ncbi:MAG: tRNA (N(6)-L-threonylcarbamoyladenosine(37)-C(2))-methylthiotransferase MtaB, partial [Treponema sp.]|nr:tRNA (N(6)-L-threonylcarbamoyladenosine(37)-C(2))-methylthiotransferase MtaB [Treponema sp.]